MASEGGSSNLLQLFWGLSSVDDSERLEAARKLVLSLRELQVGCEAGLCSELEYCLQRLVRGLASSRKGARQGYFVVLTELLSLFPEIPLSQIFELVHKHLESIGNVKGQEDRGAYFGRAFALLALIQSDRLTETADVVEVVRQLVVCGRKKVYLRELTAVSISRLLEQCSASVVGKHVVPLLGLKGGWHGYTPEQLYLVLFLSKHYGQHPWFKALTKTHWGGKSIISSENYEKLATILLESSSAHPRLHSVWPLVLSAVRNEETFGAFWKTVVDDSLFVSSHERRFLGLKLFESLLPTLTTAEVSQLFSPNLLRCLVNNASSPDNYLHAAAKHSLSEITSATEACSDPSVPIAVLLHLYTRTRAKFDHLTGSKTTESILLKLDSAGLEQLLRQLQALFCNPPSMAPADESDDSIIDGPSMQLWILDQILTLVRNRQLPTTESWLLEAAQFLFLHALFNVNQPRPELSEVPSVPLGKAVREKCVERFSSVLTVLSCVHLKMDVDGVSMPTYPGTMVDGRPFLAALVDKAQQLLSMEGSATLVEPFSNEESVAWETVTSMVATLSEKNELALEEKVFLWLISAMGIQLFLERSKQTQVIEELKVCYEEMQLSRTKTPKRRRTQTAAGPGWVEVLTDLLLGLLSRSSQFWRNVVDRAFKMAAHCITPSALQLILKVLELENKEELMEREEEEEEEEEEEQADQRADSLDGSGDEEEEEEGEEVDPAFRVEVKKALGEAAIDTDNESSGSDLDDDAMMAIDEALAAAFRSRVAKKHLKKQKKDDEKSVIQFKLRALDLVEIYIQRQSSNPSVLDLVLPLYRLVHHGKAGAPLADRAARILRNRLCHLKDYPKKGLNGDHVHTQLEQLLHMIYKANSAHKATLVTQGCMFLIRVLRGSETPPTVSPLTTRAGRKRRLEDEPQPAEPKFGLLNVSMVTGWFSEVLHNFVTKKNSNVYPVFFHSYIERYPVLSWLLVPEMLKDLPAAANYFRKVQVYEMMSLLLSQKIEEKALCTHLRSLSPSLLVFCEQELTTAHQRPPKHTLPLLRMTGNLVATLRSQKELSSVLELDKLSEVLSTLASSPSVSERVRKEGERVGKALWSEEGVSMTTGRKRKRNRREGKGIESEGVTGRQKRKKGTAL